MKVGAVYLVGAGPGDPGLITVKGLRLLHAAQVVVHDRLVSQEILAEAAPDAEMVDVGKKPGHHILPQEEINALLVKRARTGKRVVRLKGGDPFVFGRGGEEAEALAEAGVPFEVVPGITSAIAVPAYAGIPVTDRRYASSFRVMTGHGADTSSPGKRETVVILMPLGALPKVIDQLQCEGWHSETPVAFVQQGTTPRQRTLVTTLREAIEAARRAAMGPPAVLVVGEAVRLREKIAWVKEKP